MTDDLATLLDVLHELGYDAITRTESHENEASGCVPLPTEHRRTPRTGWRRFIPGVYCDAGNLDLVPDDLRSTVETHDWTVQAMGRTDETVTVVISENGV